MPFEGLRVVEFTHMVMGPTCGMVLADLGAEVIKVEPIGHGHEGAQVLEEGEGRKVARLDLRMGGLRTWFMTENTLVPPHHIDMRLIDGPFRKLGGRWEFHSLDESACKVTLTLDFEPAVKLLGAAMAVGFQSLADRMVDDFVRVADRGDAA